MTKAAARAAIAQFLTFTVTVERATGHGTYGATYDPPVDLPAMIDDTRALARDVDGATLTSGTRVILDADTPTIPLGSRVTLPAQFEPRRRTVIGADRAITGPAIPTPDHLQLTLD